METKGLVGISNFAVFDAQLIGNEIKGKAFMPMPTFGFLPVWWNLNKKEMKINLLYVFLSIFFS